MHVKSIGARVCEKCAMGAVQIVVLYIPNYYVHRKKVVGVQGYVCIKSLF